MTCLGWLVERVRSSTPLTRLVMIHPVAVPSSNPSTDQKHTCLPKRLPMMNLKSHTNARAVNRVLGTPR